MKKLLLLTFIIFSSVATALAQSGTLKGQILDKDKKEGIPFVNVVLELNGSMIAGGTTDFDGYFTVKPIPPGKYTVKASSVGFAPVELQGVVITSDNIRVQNISMSSSVKDLGVVEIIEIKGAPLIDPGNTTSGGTQTRDDIKNATSRDVKNIASTTAGVNQRDDGANLNIKGARSNSTYYYIDGVKVRGSIALPQQGIEQISVITGGIPAQYGDATGGIVTMTTRGPSKEFHGGLEYTSSEMFDGYGHNIATANISGPLKAKYDTSLKTTRSILGFFLVGEFESLKDPSPSAVPLYRLKDEKMAELEVNPLSLSPTGSGYVYNTEFVKKEDFEEIKAKQNALSQTIRFTGKVDYQPVLNTTFVVGGSLDFNNRHEYIRDYSLFNPRNNPQVIDNTYRVYGKFTQKFNSATSTSKESASTLKNAYYTIQVDYENSKSKTQDDSHKDRLFNYGHIGTFNTYKERTYQYGTDTINGEVYSGYIHNAFRDTALLFDGGENPLNPIATEYTKNAYRLQPDGFTNSNDLIEARGLLNGVRADNVYALWLNTGREYNGYSYDEQEQFRITATGSADIGNHAIMVGMEYEQRTERVYSTGPVGLWGLMRQLGNQKNTQLDLANPVIATGFQEGDTIYYNRLYAADGQTGFYENVRSKLGVGMNEYIDIDSYSPDQFDLSLFTPDELLDNGLIGYYGYDYLGNKQKSKPSFDDFFTKKDDKGNFTRDVGAFQPIYVAGYIQDVFAFNDLTFNVGVRVDRFDANQKVLKDRFLLYNAKTVAESDASLNPTQKHPDNIPSDATVYVNDRNQVTQIVGYRDGENWYDYQGVLTTDPLNVIGKATTTGSITPYLLDPTQVNVSSDAFEDYKPQTNIMPRISFSFPISDDALFFAHYDVLTQRPSSNLRMDPMAYYYLEQSVSPTVNNPNLKPERTTDYELGFKQKVTVGSALKLSGFYREFRNMIQLTNVVGAYPKNYQTYDNLDFGTAKGFIVEYDLRRLGNARATANYTLMYADGTGSGATTGANLIGNGKPNLRIPLPLDFDQRHSIALTVDYRYGSGKGDEDYNGPKIGGKNVLAGAGANVRLSTGSGYPYSRQSNVIQEGASGLALTRNLSGTINGSRLPWQYRVDLRIDKEFPLVIAKNSEKKRQLGMRVYLNIQNLLNTKNITGVYRATGNPNDDGYLTDAASQNAISAQNNEESFRYLYAIRVNNPGNYSLPRRMRLGIELNF